ncbi:hypothetical protein LIER_35313 [Lithospermum erythrorhizon]|uniref:RNase H type-1 domain-containing protein n=1 Tax=Lithospermum erythrorhizon TaxID=34254 RepID=A0AAV3NPY0_LITER
MGIQFLQSNRSNRPLALFWNKPNTECIKLNVNGSYCHQSLAGDGGILRDHRGGVLKAFTHQYQALSAFHSELLAVYDGLRLCSDLGLQQVIIETDSM